MPALKNLTDWFDQVYLINCQHRPDRLERVMKHLDDSGMATIADIQVVAGVIGDWTTHPAGWGGGRGAWGCVLPDNLVQGRINAASKSSYDGDAVRVITASGHRVTLTVNHPVLTTEGFVAAGALHKGHQLLRYVGNREAAPSSDHVNNQPPLVGEMFDALVREGHSTHRKRVSRLDFYGDGRCMHGDVDIVDVDGPLLHTVHPTSSKATVEDQLVTGHPNLKGALSGGCAGPLSCQHVAAPDLWVGPSVPPQLVSGASSPRDHPVSVEDSPDSATARVPDGRGVSGMVVESGCQAGNAFSSNVAAGDVSLRAHTHRTTTGEPDRVSKGPDRDGIADEPVGNRLGRHAVAPGDALRGFAGGIADHPVIDVLRREPTTGRRYYGVGLAAQLDTSFFKPAFEDVGAEVEFARELRGRHPGLIACDELVDVERFYYSGDVFDFVTTVGHFTVSAPDVNDGSGLIVSNCLKSHIKVMESAMHLRDDRGQLNWNSILILEDDVFFVEDALPRLNAFMEALPQDWGQLYLGGQHRRPVEATTFPGVVTGRSVNRTHAYAISARYVQSLYCHVSYMPDYVGNNKHIDHQLELAHQRGDWPVYCPEKWIAGQDEGTSNVSGRTNNRHLWD